MLTSTYNSFPFPFPNVSLIDIPMGFPRDSQWEWKSPIPHSHDHRYCRVDMCHHTATRRSVDAKTRPTQCEHLCEL